MTSFIDWQIKGGEINYIEYSEFSNVKLVDKGAFGIISSADRESYGIKIALKILVDNPSVKEDNKDNVNYINDFVKEVTLLTLYSS